MNELELKPASDINTLVWRVKTTMKEMAYRLRLLKRPKSGAVLHAEREFVAAGYTPLNQDQEDGPNKWIQQNVLELLEVFSRQGHSGSSAPYCISMFKKLAMYEPLVPLSGDDNEWNDIGNGTWQNNRCSRVFKEADGKAYDIDGCVFRESNGCCYTSRDSRVYITFPYTPTTEYVDVADHESSEI